MPEALSSDYREYAAHRSLQGDFVCLWTQKISPDAPYLHPVLPDACVDIVFIGGAPAVVAGPATLPVLAQLPAGATVVGARFRPGAAPSWLRLPAYELLNLDAPLRDIWGPAADQLQERIAEAPTDGARLAWLTTELRGRLGSLRGGDPLVDGAIASLASPGASVQSLSRDLFLSERQLLRRFKERVGYGPKTLQRILRLQRFLQLAAGRGQSLSALAQAAGYADQAHMTREVRELAGASPKTLLGRGAGTLGMSDLFNHAAPLAR